jgi:hypothetical protein
MEPRCAEGNAMLMTVASSATISCTTETHSNVSQRRADQGAALSVLSVLSGRKVVIDQA